MDRAIESNEFQPSGPSASETRDDGQRFTLVRRLGKGSSGEVHEGLLNLSEGGQRRIAIKILADDPRDEPGRLRALVEQTLLFDHPNVVAPFEFVASSAGRVLLTEFVEGLSLVEFQRRLKRLGRPLPPPLALEIIAQALEGLIYLHGTGQSTEVFIHKNIKPSNLMVGADGCVRIIDLGVSSPLMDAGSRNKGLAVMNVLPYMAPEQLAEVPRVTVSTDLYSLATVAYELLAGRLLFDGSAARRELEIRVGFGVQDKVRALDTVLPGIAAVLGRALALVPGDRYRSAVEMYRDLEPLRPETQRKALAAMVQELQALPDKPLTMSRPADAPTQPGRAESRPSEIRSKLEASTLVRSVEPIPASVFANPRKSHQRDVRMKVGIGVVSLAIAFGALWWVDRSRQPAEADKPAVLDRALDREDGAADRSADDGSHADQPTASRDASSNP